MKRIIIGTAAVLGVAALLVWGREGAAQEGWRGPEMMDPMMDMMDEDIDLFEAMQMPQGGPGGMERGALAEKLALTDEQKQKMETLHTAFAKDMARLRADVEVAAIELSEIMGQTSPKAADAQVRAAKVSQTRAKAFERMVAFRVDMKNVLTPEQQKTLKEQGRMMRGPMMKGMMRGPMMKGMRGEMGRPGFGPRLKLRGMPEQEMPEAPATPERR